MAPAREDNNSYGCLGAGGKLRRLTSRRAGNSKPYDRPPTALRIPNNGGGGGGSGGWLSKFVDPAQRFISYSAHRLFASVFRKRLPPPPPPSQQDAFPQSPGKEERDEHGEGVYLSKRDQVMMKEGNSRAGDPGRGGVIELEQALKHKTFTRSEIDRLTALLHSKSADMPSGQDEKMLQMTSSKPMSSANDSIRRLSNTALVRENVVDSHLELTPAVNQSVHDEDVSPTQLAKAYMGGRNLKASPLTDDMSLRGIRHIPQKSSAKTIVPRPADPASTPNNGFTTPRSRGRSAIYNMAWTPYSRINSRFNLKDTGISVDINAKPPSLVSPSLWDQTKWTAPKEKSLKRGSSVLQNDIGSAGPMRRIRQKTNLLSSRSLMQRASLTSLSAPKSTSDADATLESESSIEPKYKMSLRNGKNSTPVVATQSNEMASKILQELDKLVSSPSKLSPSRLRGKALRSLEKVDSSKFLDNVENYEKVTQSSMFLPASHESTPENLNKIEGNGSKRLLGPFESVTSSASVLDASVPAKDTTPSFKCADTDAIKRDAYSPQNERTFRMSVPDDTMDWDDDSHPHGVSSSIPAEDEGKKEVFGSDSKIVSSKAIAIRHPQAASDVKYSPTASTGILDESVAAEENATFTFPSVSSAVASFSQQHRSDKASSKVELNNATLINSFGGKAAPSPGPNAVSSTSIFSFGDKVSQIEESNVSPVISFGDKVTPVKEVYSASPIISFDSKNVDQTLDLARSSPSLVPGRSDSEAGALPPSRSESLSGLTAFSVGVTGAQHPDLENFDHKGNISKIHEEVSSLTTLPSTSAVGIHPFGASSHGSFSNSFPSTISSASPTNFTSQTRSDSSSFTTQFSSAPDLKLDLATVSSIMSSTIAVTPGAESDNKTNDKTEYGTSSSNQSSSIFSSTSNVAITVSGILGLAPATSLTTNNVSQGSLDSCGFGFTTSSPFTAQASSTGSGTVTSTQSMPVQFGSSVVSSSSGLGVNSGSTSSSSLFNSSATTTNLFNGGKISSQSSLASSSELNFGSSGGATTELSATAVQPGKSPVCGSTSCTNGFAFGALTTAADASNVVPVVFGSSNSSSSSSSFSFNSSTSSTTVQPIFSNLSASTQPAFGGASAASSQPAFGGASAASSQPAFGGASAASSQPASQPAFGGTSAASSQPFFGGTSAASSQPIFGSASTASSQPIFGGASAASSQPIFGGTSAASHSIFGGTSTASQPAFGGTSASSQPAFGSTSKFSQSAFGNHSSGFPFGWVPSGNNNEMGMEDSMAEDTIHASTPAPATPLFGQQPNSHQQSGSVFGSTAPAGQSPFQFGSQQNLSTSQNPLPFQASGSLNFQAGGSFSLGSSGGDKSKRKIVRVKHRGRK